MAINPDEAKGRVKQAVGDLTDDDQLKNEGRADKAAGKAKDALKSAEDAGEKLVDKVREVVQGN
ncbi:MAG: CsbD family protein [Actinomycetota bacterium]|nr:CsbD family protein [Actinomycetota bacterium]